MQFHLDRKLRLNTETGYKNLYSWAIQEVRAENAIESDQIPWEWTLYFTAEVCTVSETLRIQPQKDASNDQSINLQMHPGALDKDGPRYEMFGASRPIKDFSLAILPTTDEDKIERCSAWGSPSYTSEQDFRQVTTDDCLTFYLLVKPETFSRYREEILNGSITEIGLGVSGVDGFYSDWSPSISTNRIKVLARGSEQQIDIPDDVDIEPPRLGSVAEARLFINRRQTFGSQPAEPDIEPSLQVIHQDASLPPPSRQDGHAELKRPLWFAVILLGLIFLRMVLR